MTCLAAKNFRENQKAIKSLRSRCCPRINKERSTIYHPDVNLWATEPAFIPTDEARKNSKCKSKVPLYNERRRGGRGFKILQNDRRKNCCDDYWCPWISIGCDPYGNEECPVLICGDCGCTYRTRNPRTCPQQRCQLSENVSKDCLSVMFNCNYSQQNNNVIYFRANVLPPPPPEICSSSTIIDCPCQDCRQGSEDNCGGDQNHHYLDCNCKLCKTRKENCPNRPIRWAISNPIIDCESIHCPSSEACVENGRDWSSPFWFQCQNQDCECNASSKSPSSHFNNSTSQVYAQNDEHNFTLTLNKIQSETCQKTVVMGDDGKLTAIPCKFLFVPDSTVSTSLNRNDGINNSGCLKADSQNSSKMSYYCGRRRCCPGVCDCIYCENVANHKRYLHGPQCACMCCEKFRAQCKIRQNYDCFLRDQNRIHQSKNNYCSENYCQQCQMVNPCCSHGPLCTCPANYMVPQPLSPQEEWVAECAAAEAAKKRAKAAKTRARKKWVEAAKKLSEDQGITDTAEPNENSNPEKYSSKKFPDLNLASVPNTVCACHQYVPSNWERSQRSSNCGPCPSDNNMGSSSQICPPTLVRPRCME